MILLMMIKMMLIKKMITIDYKNTDDHNIVRDDDEY